MDAVILDVGGVLLVPHFETVTPVLEPFGVVPDSDRAEKAHYHGAHALDVASDEAVVDAQPYLTAYTRAFGVQPPNVEIAAGRIREAWRRPNIEVWRQRVRGSMDGLRQLATTGVKLGIISNSDGTVEEQLRRHEICQIGEGLGVAVLAIIDSGVVGVSKPAAEIFRHALQSIAVAPERALYVGDTVRYDVRGARAAGLVPVHMDPYELCDEPADHAHIRRVAEVVTLLGV